jgi:hypothetical protein
MRAPRWNWIDLVETKERTLLAGRATRWWLAPVRLPTATLTLLRRAAERRELPHVDPWVRQTPNGIRA